MAKAGAIGATLLLCATLASAAPALQTRLGDVPVFPGAVRDAAETARAALDAKQQADWRLLAIRKDVYASSASPEAVFLWYAEKYGLDPKAPAGAGLSSWELDERGAPGDFSRLSWSISPSAESPGSHPGEIGGKDSREGAFGGKIGRAIIGWAFIETSGNYSEIYIEIGGESASQPTGNGTRICVGGLTRLSSAQAEERGRETSIPTAKPKQAKPETIPAGEPSAESIGLPLYPGAKFQPEAGDPVRVQGLRSFTWTTGDPPAKVLAYYEWMTGLRHEANSSGGHYRIVKKRPGGMAMVRIDAAEVGTGIGGETTITVFLMP